MAALLTARDTLLSRDEYCQLVFAGLQSLPGFGLPSLAAAGAAAAGAGAGAGGLGGAAGSSADSASSAFSLRDVELLPPAVRKGPGRGAGAGAGAGAGSGSRAGAGAGGPLWTGKQVVSTLLKALTAHLEARARPLHCDGKAKVPDGMWGAGAGKKEKDFMSGSSGGANEGFVVVRNSELLCGVLDKNALGNSSYGLVHAVHEAHGATMAGRLLSAMGRLLTVFLSHCGATCGVGDLCLAPAADARRRELVVEGAGVGERAAAAFAGVAAAPTHAHAHAHARRVRIGLRDRLRGGAAGADATGAAVLQAAVQLDNAVKSAMAATHSKLIEVRGRGSGGERRERGRAHGRARSPQPCPRPSALPPAAPPPFRSLSLSLSPQACLPYGLARDFPKNQFSLMVASGAKGSLVNHAMIAVGLGQQEVRTPGRKSVVRTDGRAGGRGGTRSEQHRGRPSHPPPLPSSPPRSLSPALSHPSSRGAACRGWRA